MRETKTVAEVEALIFEQLRAMPNGQEVEGVSINLELAGGLGPAIGIGYTADGDFWPLLNKAARLFEQYRQDYDLKPE